MIYNRNKLEKYNPCFSIDARGNTKRYKESAVYQTMFGGLLTKIESYAGGFSQYGRVL